MKINLSKYIDTNNSIARSASNLGEKLDVSGYDEFMQQLLKKLKAPSTEKELEQILEETATNSNDLQMQDGVFFKHKDFTIQMFLKPFAQPYEEQLKILKNLHLNITPQIIETIEKDSKHFIISRIPGTQTGKLQPLWQGGYDKVSHDAKLEAFKDLQKLTKAGFVDDSILSSNRLWFYNPEGQIILPCWQNLRKIRQDESQREIIGQYYKIIFRK